MFDMALIFWADVFANFITAYSSIITENNSEMTWTNTKELIWDNNTCVCARTRMRMCMYYICVCIIYVYVYVYVCV